MKAKLKEKYVSVHYRNQLYDKFLNLRQTSNVPDYISQFNELLIRCDVNDEEWRILTKFVNGLKPHIQKELRLNFPESLEEAYHKALEIESLLPNPSVRRFDTQSAPFRQNRSFNPSERSSGASPLRINPPFQLNQTTSFKGSTSKPTEPIVSTPHPSNPLVECFRCHAKGHIASRCPHRALALETYPENVEEDDADLVIEPISSPSDVDEEIIIDEQGNETRHVGVMRCILSVPLSDDTWKRKSIFHSYIKVGDKSCKLVIDGGSSSNVISYQE